MGRAFFFAGALLGLLSVAAGAFGAHVLRGRLSPDMMNVFELAARYQMYHALALLAAGWLNFRVDSRLALWSGWLLLSGTVIFSGSLYLLSLTETPWLGAITPLGGLFMLSGWLFLALAALHLKGKSS